jgi:hypothetical protein
MIGQGFEDREGGGIQEMMGDNEIAKAFKAERGSRDIEHQNIFINASIRRRIDNTS